MQPETFPRVLPVGYKSTICKRMHFQAKCKYKYKYKYKSKICKKICKKIWPEALQEDLMRYAQHVMPRHTGK